MDDRERDAQAAIAGDMATPPEEPHLVQLWRQSRRWLAAIIYAHKPRSAEVDDLMQEVAMKLVQHGHELGNPRDLAAIRPWLRTVAINVARSAGRRTRTRHRAAESLENQARARQGNGQAVAGRDDDTALGRGRRALECVQTLPPVYREALLLSLRGLSQRQIAEVMELPVTTVETRLIRARRMVRDDLEREDAQRSATMKIEVSEVFS